MQECSPISPQVIKVDFKNLNVERRKRYEEVVRQWWMKREGGEERRGEDGMPKVWEEGGKEWDILD